MVALPTNFNVTKINLSGLGIKKIPQEIFLYKNLRKLFLQNNEIDKIPSEIKQLKLLNTLDISNNQIASLYASIFELKNLEVLILNNNKIKTIPLQIKNLKKLRKLGIANNRLVNLNQSFEFLKELKELNLSGNNLHEFPFQIISKMDKLERLWIKQEGPTVFSKKSFINVLPNLKYINTLIQPISQIQILETNNVQKAIKIGKEKRMNPDKKKIFISYSHQDSDWLKRVKKHLKGLSLHTESDFEVWDDERISSGKKWKEEIKKALEDCTAAILLISSDFLASDFIHKEELQPLLNKAKKDGTLILQLIINPCGFKRIKSLNEFQAVNNPTTQILTKLNNHEQDEIFEKLADDVEKHIKG